MKNYTLLAISRVDVVLGDLWVSVMAGDRIVLPKIYKDILDGLSQSRSFIVIAESESEPSNDQSVQNAEADSKQDQLLPLVDPLVEQLISDSIPEPAEASSAPTEDQPDDQEAAKEDDRVYIPLEPDASWQAVKAYLNQLEEVFPLDKAKVKAVKEMFPSYPSIQTLCNRLLAL